LTLDEKTKVGFFAVVGAIPVFAGFVFWISMIYFKADAAERMNNAQDVKLDSQMQILLDIRDRITRLEQKLDRAK
jgi:hypothetical protein